MPCNIHHNTGVGKITQRIPMQNHHKIQSPLISHNRRLEGYATYTFFSEITSFEGYNFSQYFVVVGSKFRAAYGITTESDGPEAMIDFSKIKESQFHSYEIIWKCRQEKRGMSI